jgi:hypothetical protein
MSSGFQRNQIPWNRGLGYALTRSFCQDDVSKAAKRQLWTQGSGSVHHYPRILTSEREDEGFEVQVHQRATQGRLIWTGCRGSGRQWMFLCSSMLQIRRLRNFPNKEFKARATIYECLPYPTRARLTWAYGNRTETSFGQSNQSHDERSIRSKQSVTHPMTSEAIIQLRRDGCESMR